MTHLRLPILALLAAGPLCAALAGPTSLLVRAHNPLAGARAGETIELAADQLAALGAKSLDRLHVWDAAGAEVLAQAVDTDFDPLHRPDQLIFQSDFAPSETRTFRITAGAKQVYRLEQFRAHGRFVRERFDDFAWENDRIARRMYGRALETWAGEPLTSSTMDMWFKRVPEMVVDQWYLVDNYHADTGQGGDFYSAGPSRGCGGSGLWADGRLWVSANFTNSRVLANGPLRVLFELDYAPFAVAGRMVTETKRILLDAGRQLDRVESRYTTAGAGGPLVAGIGLKKAAGEEKVYEAAAGWLALGQPAEKKQGWQGLALLADPRALAGEAEDALNHLLLLPASPEGRVVYQAGFAWDRAGRIADLAAWTNHLVVVARGLAAPIRVEIAPE